MVKISSILKTSFIDYPGKITYVIFFQGCNLSCSFCSNFELVPLDSESKEYVSEEEVLSTLLKHKQMYDAVTLIGGEPTIQEGLVEFCVKLKKETGLLIKLDTNGLRPNVVKELIEKKLIDYVALDIKTITINNERYKEAVNYLVSSGFPYELRLTCVPTIITDDNIKDILDNFNKDSIIFLQNFSNIKTLDKSLQKITPYSEQKLQKWVDKYSKTFKNLKLR